MKYAYEHTQQTKMKLTSELLVSYTLMITIPYTVWKIHVKMLLNAAMANFYFRTKYIMHK
jgi:hypothetical protein